jgi:hypothetical protein
MMQIFTTDARYAAPCASPSPRAARAALLQPPFAPHKCAPACRCAPRWPPRRPRRRCCAARHDAPPPRRRRAAWPCAPPRATRSATGAARRRRSPWQSRQPPSLRWRLPRASLRPLRAAPQPPPRTSRASWPASRCRHRCTTRRRCRRRRLGTAWLRCWGGWQPMGASTSTPTPTRPSRCLLPGGGDAARVALLRTPRARCRCARASTAGKRVRARLRAVCTRARSRHTP